jgi:hypothetical protein
MDEAAAYFERLGDGAFFATSATQSPWDPRLQHGGPPTALLARVMLESHPREEMRLVRITTDFLGPIPRGRVEVRSRVVRPGKRIELLEAALTSDGRDAVVARAWRVVAQPPGSVPPGVTPPVPVPARPGEQQPPPWLRGWGYGESIEWRYIYGSHEPGPASVWSRLRVPLIAGEEAHPLDHALVVVDSANGISGELPMGDWLFVPPSLTVALERYPRGDWTLLEARTTLSDDGAGLCTAQLADDDGYYGQGLQALYVERRRT